MKEMVEENYWFNANPNICLCILSMCAHKLDRKLWLGNLYLFFVVDVVETSNIVLHFGKYVCMGIEMIINSIKIEKNYLNNAVFGWTISNFKIAWIKWRHFNSIP